jgi:hypothetical protein
MTLNDWSLVVFAMTAFYYFVIYFALFRTPTIGKFILLILAWIAQISTIFLYGLATRQIGFIFIAALEILMIGLVYVITQRLVTDDSE